MAQDEATFPLLTNPVLQYKAQKKQAQRSQRTFADIYVYAIDTIGLPVVDDFSSDLFRQYDAQPGDANVTMQQYFQLMQGATPMHDTTKFRTDTTYFVLVDTTANGSDTSILTPLSSITITFNDLQQYPIISSSVTVWPRYQIIDTAYLPSSPDTVYLLPDLVQDSVYVYFVAADDPETIWIDHYALRNNSYPVDPPSIGVVTFDGLDDTGYPYNFPVANSYGQADVLTSKYIALNYPAGDSVYLGFFYQPEGRGNEPESNDSLVLEFYSPADQAWHHIWSVPGTALNSFQQVIIPITSSNYLMDGFRFRFRNYATLSGSFDHWHIDYVELRRFSSMAGYQLVDDVAFRYQAHTLLKDYTAMPWKHFKWLTAAYMRDTVTVFQRNNNFLNSRLVGNNNMRVYYNSILQTTVNNLNTPSINPSTLFKTTFDVGNAGYWYDTTVNDTCATFDVEFTHFTNPDENNWNDTMRFQQVFENYYAYDDGSAEVAYSPQGVGAQLAYKFTTTLADTLRSVKIHFSPSGFDVSLKPFYLTVWDATGSGGAPGNIIYQNSNPSYPIYTGSVDGFHEYHFEVWQNISGNFYVGYKQTASDQLHVGMDLNYNNQSKIYYKTSSINWTMTSKNGSLLMRPVFTSKKDYLLNIPVQQNHFEEEIAVEVYPNPTGNEVWIRSGLPQPYQVNLFDMQGRLVWSDAQNRGTFSTQQIENGMYLLHLSDGVHTVSTRLLVQH